MSKNKLTMSQKRNVARRVAKLCCNQDNDIPEIQGELGAVAEGTVVSRYGKTALVENNDSRILFRVYIRRTIESIVTGDKVLFRPPLTSDEKAFGLVETVLPRTALLSRPDYYDGLRPVAANISLIVTVTAKQPEFSTNIIDRYVAAAEYSKIPTLIVVNKHDLFTENEKGTLDRILSVYREIGYETMTVSASTGFGINSLKERLSQETSILAGQSGVGKSSILNVLIPGARAETGTVSENSNLGQHTTTGSRLYHFENGGVIIDSPGVREFALWHLSREDLTKCYREIASAAASCRFRDCRHKDDPGCAVREAVSQGRIADFRYENYHRILESMTDNMPDAYRTPGKRNSRK
ncbi:small ribosomal subunit biogenesis GTPase RsgA [Succinimonas amylolytica]|uniref:small ribosomal subunit biogenesis GTPase RsgA n=1 Tax=Succinimonas amylolytica TaxID=83769 RepID=UPI00036B31E4|nr:small ribosomal subunit biogenesis GTPase RsgA [Succinimonas amylolytica]